VIFNTHDGVVRHQMNQLVWGCNIGVSSVLGRMSTPRIGFTQTGVQRACGKASRMSLVFAFIVAVGRGTPVVWKYCQYGVCVNINYHLYYHLFIYNGEVVAIQVYCHVWCDGSIHPIDSDPDSCRGM
jgi:hypothetical protein